MIHQHREEVTTTSGSTSSTSLDIISGLCRQVFVQAATSTTTFRVRIEDAKGYAIRNYGYSTGEINEVTMIPMRGVYKIYVTNASPDDTFKILLGVEE